ncbi:hypothetical protein OVA24_21220 [Luteolibacter sp. SL250]|uniref:hypothetical protein n=1 Tax=Luteolibacter sp. SL250 TaxID=2995170 RepID=UPI002271A32C|nr:hypothetical protein [Luteolibacter sp. SL250]WAC19743.1 hypothetical protein OVA24_21220 [Luteolibacter sp. SL250]
MKSLVAAFAFTFACIGCSPPKGAGGGPPVELVTEVDRIKLPVAAADLSDDDYSMAAVQDEPAFLALTPELRSLPAMKEGVTASLIGPRERPEAMIFYVNSLVGTYYVPFPGVKEVDRPRRLTKLADRLYRIESNRSSQGIQVIGPLP